MRLIFFAVLVSSISWAQTSFTKEKMPHKEQKKNRYCCVANTGGKKSVLKIEAKGKKKNLCMMHDGVPAKGKMVKRCQKLGGKWAMQQVKPKVGKDPAHKGRGKPKVRAKAKVKAQVKKVRKEKVEKAKAAGRAPDKKEEEKK